MKDLEELLTKEGKVEAIFDVLRTESIASSYAEHDLDSIHFVNHVRNYLKGMAGTSRTVTRDLLPIIRHHYRFNMLESNVYISAKMTQFSYLMTAFGTIMTLSVGYNLFNAYSQAPSEQDSFGVFLLGLGVSLIGFGIVDSIKEGRRLKRYLNILKELGDPFTDEEARQPWIDAVEEIYKNEGYRERALSLVGN
jgi:hypothetical protein